MPVSFKCTRCAQLYHTRVTVCQLCGGECVAAEPREPKLADVTAATEPPPPAPASCPCCEGPRGPHSVAQQTRHLKDVSFIPAKSTYLVTTVTIPGVCDPCHRSLQRKRYYADLLVCLPLPLLFGLLVVTDSKLFFVLVLAYLIYLARAFNYAWPDFLLYGQALSWKLVDYVPAKDATSSPRYPVGLWHVIVRFGFYPALLAVFVFLVNAGIVKKSHFKSDRPEKKVEAAATPATVPTKPSAPPKPPALERARALLATTSEFYWPVSSATLKQPSLGQPVARIVFFEGQQRAVVPAYAAEKSISTGNYYQAIAAATLLANFTSVKSDGLYIEDQDILLSPAEVAMLAAEHAGPRLPPSEIRVGGRR